MGKWTATKRTDQPKRRRPWDGCCAKDASSLQNPETELKQHIVPPCSRKWRARRGYQLNAGPINTRNRTKESSPTAQDSRSAIAKAKGKCKRTKAPPRIKAPPKERRRQRKNLNETKYHQHAPRARRVQNNHTGIGTRLHHGCKDEGTKTLYSTSTEVQ